MLLAIFVSHCPLEAEIGLSPFRAVPVQTKDLRELRGVQWLHLSSLTFSIDQGTIEAAFTEPVME